MKKVAILQSNYIPWKGYFDLINSVDEFILYDDMQYTKNDWRNRNKIKTASGLQWLTIPVRQKSLDQHINETETTNNLWLKKHWSSISQNYRKSRYYAQYAPLFESFYTTTTVTNLSEINHSLILLVNEVLDIRTKISLSSDFELIDGKTERLVELCRQCGASTYLSGPSAKAYLDIQQFHRAGIQVEWMEYSGYPEYHQLYPPFQHQVSVLDLIFNEVEDARIYMKSFDEVGDVVV